MVAESFPEDAVELPHSPQRDVRPPIGRDNRLDIFPKRPDEFRVPGETVDYFTNDLKGCRRRVQCSTEVEI